MVFTLCETWHSKHQVSYLGASGILTTSTWRFSFYQSLMKCFCKASFRLLEIWEPFNNLFVCLVYNQSVHISYTNGGYRKENKRGQMPMSDWHKTPIGPFWPCKFSTSSSLQFRKKNWQIFKQVHCCSVLVGWLVVLRIYVASAVFQPYRDLEAGDNQSLKFKWRDQESNPGPLAPKAKSLTTRPPPLPSCSV